MKFVWLFVTLFVIILVVASATYLLEEEYIINLSEEDRLVENVNALLFLASSFVGFHLCFKCYTYRKALLFLSLVSIVGFLDELSFGARIFGFKMPVIYGASIDAVHDFIYLGIKVLYKLTLFYPIYMVSFLLLAILLFAFIVHKYRYKLTRILKKLSSNRPSFLLASFFVMLLSLALLIDLDQVENEFLYLLEELFELNAAIALLFWILSLQYTHLRVTVPGYPSIPVNLDAALLATNTKWQKRFIKAIFLFTAKARKQSIPKR